MTGHRSRGGSVLALTILVLMALQLLAHGALVMAQSEWAASMAGLRLLQARAGAEAGAAVLERALPGSWDTIPILGVTPVRSGTLAGNPFQGQARRLSREYWLLEGRGRSLGETWGVDLRRVVWILDPLGRVAAAGGAAEVVGTPPNPGGVEADNAPAEPCGPWQAALDSVKMGAPWGSAVQVSAAAAGEPSLGHLAGRELSQGLTAVEATQGTPGPALLWGRCATAAPWNWGDPANPHGPCGDVWVVRVAAGDLRLDGGVGQGLLVVSGDLDLVGARFDGVVLTGGTATLREGSRVTGLLRVGGDLVVSPGAGVVGSPCRALRALLAAGAMLQRPVRIVDAGVLEGRP